MSNRFFINANITLNDIAKKRIVVWPMIKNLRTSFWFGGDRITCPCEIRSDGNISEINKPYEVTIMLPKSDSLNGRLLPGAIFYFGLHSEPIGEGKIIEEIQHPVLTSDN